MSFLIIFLPITIQAALMEECYYDGDDFCVSQDDILSVDLLPGTFLLADEHKNTTVKATLDTGTINGSYQGALSEMDYHRKRMNEYLCHGFMAEEIFKEMRSIRVKRRQDASSLNSIPEFLGDDNVTVHDKLLSDEGSSKYKEWLQRTTTLDDVYRHYAPRKKLKKKTGGKVKFPAIQEFDGEVTGYAMPAGIGPDKTSNYYEYPDDDLVSSPTGHHFSSGYGGGGPPHGGGGYGGGGPPHGGGPPPHFGPHELPIPIIHEEHVYHSPPSWQEEEYHHKSHKSKGDLSVKDFFEIALTALAFLAFGVFIIQLLMAMTNAGMTTTMAAAIEDGIRFKRQAFSSPYSSTAELNELSHRVLQSIEAAMIAKQDSGRCLRWTLCRDNRHSTQIDSAQRIWIPVWSLGMSWVSGRLLKKSSWTAMLESVKASVLGLGGADCDTLYPACNLLEEREKRRRRRKK